MGWLNATGTQIATTPLTIQIDVPSEAVGSVGASLATVNWGDVLAAAVQLIIALSTGNAVAIAAAIQALIKAILGQ